MNQPQQQQLNVNELFATIGQQVVQIRLMEQQISQLKKQVETLQEEKPDV